MARDRENQGFHLEVPLDASGVEGFKPEHEVKVVTRDRRGESRSAVATLDREGKGVAILEFPANPGAVKVMVGPANATDEQMAGLQTIGVNVSAGRARDRQKLELAPIKITSYFWHCWLAWCRNFTITGRVTCPDGSPVPGAEVCAYDVDWWWWWSATQQVGCATTDENGTFEIKFTWCCGWWPWWWWKQRYWRLDPGLVDRILPVLRRDPRLKLPVPSPRPRLDIFESLLPEAEELPSRATAKKVDPTLLSELRGRLLKRLPKDAELERLRIWPWYPWYPWWDCNPDIIFRVTQECDGQEKLILEEELGDARWNIPTTLDLTAPALNLVANDEACCLGDPDDPEGECLRIDEACRDLVAFIGGNPSAAASPAGYLSPGVTGRKGDRPYGGVVPISGVFGDTAEVHYYEFEWTETPANPASWAAMPPAACGDFRRWYWGPELGTADPPAWHRADFKFDTIDGRYVVESREHFETHNEPLSWLGGTRDWSSSSRNYLMRWLPQNVLPDGTYHLRVRGWDRVGDQLINDRVLPLCLTADDNGIVLTIDNRLETAGPIDPAGHPCGPDTVHICTAEPDTRIVTVKLLHDDATQTVINSCDNVPLKANDVLQVDFLVDDPDGHLAYYTLDATYGDSLVVPLIHTGHPGGDLLDTVPPADVSLTGAPGAQVGPNYGDPNPDRSAVDQPGATPPRWHGGTFTFKVPAHLAFPETCCYQLELRAYKRTVVDCHHGFVHWNVSEYSFMIVV
ncbi:MAG: carboxypeptidase regulatory-like domain-containing protein [bacterium]|nr:carboxypeptidase regulatory-like domain-containing protein [bacterium]